MSQPSEIDTVMMSAADAPAPAAEAQANLPEVVTFPGGVAAEFASHVVGIRLPAAPSIEQVDRVISALDRIYRRTPADGDWAVDVSAQPRLPLLVLGALLSYRDAFALRGREIRLRNVPEGAMPPAYFSRLKQMFVLDREQAP